MRKDWPKDCQASIEYDTELDWLVKLASDPNWKRYSWDKAKELERKSPEMWGGIADDLKNRMKREQP